MLTETYPNGMNANYTYNQVGKPISLEYVKTTDCTEKCTWLSDTDRPLDPRPSARTNEHPLPPSLHLRRRRQANPGTEHACRKRLHDAHLRL